MLTENDADDEVAVCRRLVDVIKLQQSLGSLIRRHDYQEGALRLSVLQPRGFGECGKRFKQRTRTGLGATSFFLWMGGSRNEGREEVPDYTAGEALYGP